MNFNLGVNLSDRVVHEKMAHTEDDVLEKSWKLKRLFLHVINSPTMHRFEKDFDRHLKNVHPRVTYGFESKTSK